MNAAATFSELASQENEALERNAKLFPRQFAFANNAISCLSTGVIGYTVSRRAFGFYWSQTSLCACLSMLSALRQHKVQVYQTLRQAVEHTAMAAYALHHPDTSKYFSSDPEKPIDHEQLRRRHVYPWLDRSYAKESGHLKNIKDDINRDYAHADIDHARWTLDTGSSENASHSMNFLDKHDPAAISADLVHVGHTALIALTTVLAVDVAIGAVQVTPHLRSEVAQLIVLGQVAMNDARVRS